MFTVEREKERERIAGAAGEENDDYWSWWNHLHGVVFDFRVSVRRTVAEKKKTEAHL